MIYKYIIIDDEDGKLMPYHEIFVAENDEDAEKYVVSTIRGMRPGSTRKDEITFVYPSGEVFYDVYPVEGIIANVADRTDCVYIPFDADNTIPVLEYLLGGNDD